MTLSIGDDNVGGNSRRQSFFVIYCHFSLISPPGNDSLLLPDFSWYVIPKPEKCTKSTQNVPK
jgi:hypothetical protein